MDSRDHITVYIDPEWLVTIRLPKGVMPDQKAIRSIMAAINAERRYRHDPYQMGADRRDRVTGDRVAGSVITIP